jgi:hypothetical protein
MTVRRLVKKTTQGLVDLRDGRKDLGDLGLKMMYSGMNTANEHGVGAMFEPGTFGRNLKVVWVVGRWDEG